MKMCEYGEVEEIVVLDNINDHMIGNVYIKFYDEDNAKSALEDLNGKYYDSRLLYGEFCPVTDFKEARCRLYNEGNCDRGGYCNFMHKKHVSRKFKRELIDNMYDQHPEFKDQRRERRRERES